MYVPKKSLKQIVDEEINVIDIYSYYVGTNIKQLPISYKSPLRQDDHPSFGIMKDESLSVEDKKDRIRDSRFYDIWHWYSDPGSEGKY